jgi:hypothetical protein
MDYYYALQQTTQGIYVIANLAQFCRGIPDCAEGFDKPVGHPLTERYEARDARRQAGC